MSIREVIFSTESVAHLQGHERMLLPLVDAAREEHAELLRVLQWFVDSDPSGLTPQLTAAKAILTRSNGSETIQS
jgi:hypothetical protein